MLASTYHKTNLSKLKVCWSVLASITKTIIKGRGLEPKNTNVTSDILTSFSWNQSNKQLKNYEHNYTLLVSSTPIVPTNILQLRVLNVALPSFQKWTNPGFVFSLFSNNILSTEKNCSFSGIRTELGSWE